MAGHSKWANIKRTKGVQDAKRGRLFTKLTKELMVAARLGGSDIDSNPRLRRAVQSAKSVSMPKDNITRAIKKGAGELEGVSFDEITFEGYGPGGVAVLVDCLTDNRNRTVAEVRHAFDRNGGNLGEVGCVNWMFDHKGELIFEQGDKSFDSDKLQEAAIEAGADDIVEEGESVIVYTPFSEFDSVRETLEKQGFESTRAGLNKIPSNSTTVSGDHLSQLLKLLEVLEDNDDVQNVYCNFDADDAELARLSEG